MKFKADVILRLDGAMIKALDAQRTRQADGTPRLDPISRSAIMRQAITEYLDRQQKGWQQIYEMPDA